MSALPLPAQPVDATQALNLSAGVSNCKVSRGRSFKHLNTGPTNDVWHQKRADLLIELLTTIGNEVGYSFNPAQMQNIYFPTAHGARGDDADAIQIGMAAIMRGKASFPIEVKVAPEITALQADVLKGLGKVVNEGGALTVKVQN